MNEPWRTQAEGLEIAVRATPRGGRDAIEGIREDAAGTRWLVVRVSAPPEDGRANQAVIRLVARALGVSPSAVTLLAGAGARSKRLLVRGDPVALGQRAVALWRADSGGRG